MKCESYQPYKFIFIGGEEKKITYWGDESVAQVVKFLLCPEFKPQSHKK